MTASAAPPSSTTDVAAKVARAFERDRYLSALLAPRTARNDLITLAAFAGELGRIPAAVSEPMIGEIRLQWWRDTLTAGLTPATGAPTPDTTSPAASSGHPIADAMIATAQRHGIPLAALLVLIDAQSERLEDAPFATDAAVIDNARRWDGGLFALAQRIVTANDHRERPEQEQFLSDAGAVYGLARILAEAPIDLSHGRTLLPWTANESIPAPTQADPNAMWIELDNSRRDLGDWVDLRLREIASRYQKADPTARVAALPIALVQPYLALSRRSGLASAPVTDISPLMRVWRLWMSHRRGSIGR